MPSSKNPLAVSDSVSSRVSRALREAASARLSGFTLVELIVVIAILAVLATVGFLALSEHASDARDARTKSNVRSVHSLISMESASTGNSPRYYVVHDSGSALGGTYLFVDGTPVALTGGNVGEAPADSNYTAGTPNWARLKLDPEKFRTSGVFPTFLPTASASSGPGILAGAVEVRTSADGRTRDAAYFQIAAVLPDSKVATVSGGIPEPTQEDLAAASASGIAVASGLVRNPYSANPAAALEEGTAVSVPEGSSGGEPEPEPEPVPENSCAANPSFPNLGTLTVGSPSSVGQAWTYSATPGNCTYSCSGGYSGTGCATAPLVEISWDDTNGRMWSNGTYASNCNAYMNPSSPYQYSGSTGSGFYLVDPDGVSWKAAFKAYCDMSNEWGGWTLVMRWKGGNITGWATANALNSVSAPNGDTFKFSDTDINALAATKKFMFVSDGTISRKRFYGGPTSSYSHTRNAVANWLAISYSDVALTTNPEGTHNDRGITHYGVSDHGVGWWETYFMTHYSPDARWVNWTHVANNYCTGNAVGCNFNMWVR